MGLSTAYYLASLSRQNPDAAPHIIHIVEPCPELFASASGKAGGFIARDWFSPALANLGSLSFDLHRQLAQEHDGRARWGWSESISYSLDRNAGAGAADSDSNSNSDAATSDRSASPPRPPAPTRRAVRHPQASRPMAQRRRRTAAPRAPTGPSA